MKAFMEIYMFYFGVLVLMSNYISITTSTPLFNLTTDQYALTVLQNSIVSDPNAILHKNWSIHTPICGWIGVSCGTKHQRVTALNLSNFELRGTIPPHLGNLTFLRVLDIHSNSFTGVLPSELSKLRRLEVINVAVNNFTGEIPSWFGSLSQLRHMYLNNNSFSGRIPSSLFNISRLQNLHMGFNNLDGNIPEEIGGLSSLESVGLESNQLRGSIPYAFFNISSLMAFIFGRNMLSGKLPNNICSNTPNLRVFTVYWNQLDGEISRNIGKCKELELLQLQSNNFTGDIPREIGSLSLLKGLYLWGNQFRGKLPEELSNLTSLSVLAVLSNFLSGAIPPFIFNMSTLQILDLSDNQFSGNLPSNMGLSLPNLEVLALQFNKLTGPIPTSINNASQLHILNLQINSFSGSIPSFPSLRLLTMFVVGQNYLSATQDMEFLTSLTNSKYLKVIDIEVNPLLGCVLPTSTVNLSQSLELFLAHDTNIRGVIPSQIGNLANLMELDLHGNQLSGSIPVTIGHLKKLGRLYLDANKLQGSIPLELCQMSTLAELNISNNELEGPIPECLGVMQSLRLILSNSNKLNPTIPTSFWNLKDLILLNLSANYFSGQIPPQIGNMKVIIIVDFSFNLFSGDIPNSIDGCQSLAYLHLSNNNFGGSIPQSLANMKGLTTLDLSNNSLTGLIPKSLQDLKFLENFNVSYNRLEGEIPNGSCFSNFTALSFVHNSALCGPARFDVPPCPEVGGGSKSKSVAQLMKYILPPLGSALAIVIIVVILIRRRKLVKLTIPASTSLGNPWRLISYIELSRATNSFSETNLLGRGSFGSVFRGVFDGGLDFAVKVFNIEFEGGNKSFETESRILSTIRHRNLVQVVGCCTNMEFKALILQFMPNGSLEKWLYSDNYCGDILQLMNYVALALEYLHHGNTFPIVHCDIKPSNVLLDEDMTARIADFGIAKLFEEGEAMIHTKTLATIGYAAPEYGSEGKVSTGADVYSFGIMLLEMFTRKKPTNDMFDGEMSLKEWVNEALQANEINQVLAPDLLPAQDRHFDKKMNGITSVFELAMKCLAVSPDERINTIEAAATLKRIKAKVETRVTTRHQQHTITIT